MNEFSIVARGKEYHGELVRFAYSYKIMMLVDAVAVTFEPDDEGSFRAIVEEGDRKKVRVKVLEEIAEELTKHLAG